MSEATQKEPRKDKQNASEKEANAQERPAGMIPSAQEDEKAVEARSTLTKEQEIEEALNCPCIQKMKEGSCGEQFIAAYRCFLESETEPKGSGKKLATNLNIFYERLLDCVEYFSSMQKCMVEHPDEYDLDSDTDESDDFGLGDEEEH